MRNILPGKSQRASIIVEPCSGGGLAKSQSDRPITEACLSAGGPSNEPGGDLPAPKSRVVGAENSDSNVLVVQPTHEGMRRDAPTLLNPS
jgi:hypothetical protein